MRKNKSLFLVLAALLAVTCLLVSCNAEVASDAGGGDKLVYATFGNGNSKTVVRPENTTASQSYELVDINSVYWVYTATKADQGGTTGATSGYPVTLDNGVPAKGLSGTIGPFSVGLWNFTLKAYKSCETSGEVTPISVNGHNYYFTEEVFTGSANNVSMLAGSGTYEAPLAINVTIEFVPIGDGTFVLDGSTKFFWLTDATSGEIDTLTLEAKFDTDTVETVSLARKVDGDTVYYQKSDSSDTSWNIAAGDYDLNVRVYYEVDSTEYDVATITGYPVKIYVGQTTRVSSEILEGNIVYAKFYASLSSTVAGILSSTEPTTFVSAYTPVSSTEGNISTSEVTTVTFPAGAVNTGSDADYTLGVEVYDILSASAATNTFIIQNDQVSVAAIDLTLKDSNNDTVFTIETVANNGTAEVTTYIAKDLTNAKVYYGNTAYKGPDDDGYSAGAAGTYTYDSSTGKLVIYTNHFSEFVVGSDDAVYMDGSAYTLPEFATYVNAGNSCEGLTATMIRNVDMSSFEWLEFIGTNSSEFRGSFDGQNNTIYGLTNGQSVPSNIYTAPTSGDQGSYFALFGYTGGNVLIKNLILIVDADISGGEACAGLISSANGNVTIENVTIKGDIRSKSKASGFIYALAANKTATLVDCVNEVNVYAKERVSGFVGFPQSTSTINYSNCVNKGNITILHDSENSTSYDYSVTKYGVAAGFTSHINSATINYDSGCENVGIIDAPLAADYHTYAGVMTFTQNGWVKGSNYSYMNAVSMKGIKKTDSAREFATAFENVVETSGKGIKAHDGLAGIYYESTKEYAVEVTRCDNAVSDPVVISRYTAEEWNYNGTEDTSLTPILGVNEGDRSGITTVKLLTNITWNRDFNLGTSITLVIDLNGHTLTTGHAGVLTGNGATHLTIKNGTLNIQNGNIYGNGISQENVSLIDVDSIGSSI